METLPLPDSVKEIQIGDLVSWNNPDAPGPDLYGTVRGFKMIGNSVLVRFTSSITHKDIDVPAEWIKPID